MAGKCGFCCKSCTAFRTFIIFGFVFITIGGALLVVWPSIFRSLVSNELTLNPTSKSYGLWKVIPIPIYMEFYLFNWTNPEEIYDHKKKPKLEELGPYVFREHREKVIAGWFPQNNTVTYQQNRTWFFEHSLSNGSLDDIITTLNVPAVTAAYSVRDSSVVIKLLLDIALMGLRTKYVVHKSARQFIFDGYDDPILDLSYFKPGSAPFDKFGWMYARNGSVTYDGIYNMRTDAAQLGTVSEWNYNNKTPFYPPPCGVVSGSAGELFPPGRDKGSLGLFSSDICRTLELQYKEDIAVEGIEGLRFWGTDRMLANASSCPNNWCFCGQDENGDICYPDGVLNVTSCKWGAPAFISFPHFYHGDPSYRSAVIGMKPDAKLHQFHLDLEPITGMPLEVSAGFQINILLQPFRHIGIFEKMPRIFFPMIWFRQTAHIDDVIGSEVKVMLLINDVGNILAYVFISLGLSLLILLGVIFVSLKWRKDDDAVYLVSQNGPSS